MAPPWAASGEVTAWLRAWRAGDEGAGEALLQRVYGELRRIAAAQFRAERPGHTLQPTAVAHEAFLRQLGQQRVEWRDRAHFFGLAAAMMRRVLVRPAARGRPASARSRSTCGARRAMGAGLPRRARRRRRSSASRPPVGGDRIDERLDAGPGLDEIDATAKEMEDAAGSTGRSVGLGLARHVRGRAAAARGDLPAARRHLAAARDLLVENGDLDMATEADLALAAIEHAAGNPAAALGLLDSGLARLDAGTPHGAAFIAETLRARIAAEAGQVDEARRRLAALDDDPAQSPSISRRLALLAVRAALARAEGRFADARRDLEDALRVAGESARAAEARQLRRDLIDLGI